MKKFLLISLIFFLIISTTLTKNSSKKLENKIFTVNENLSVLKHKYELFLLEYNYLSSPKKLLNFQEKYFENNLVSIDIKNIKKIIDQKNHLVVLENKKENMDNE